MTDNIRFRDFSKKRAPLFFELDGERFNCAPAVPVASLQEIARMSSTVTAANASDMLKEFFGVVMDADTKERIAVRMMDKVNPLDLDVAIDIMNWLLEEYGMRPTQPSSGTSNGSPTDGGGTDSTAGA
jgi:hypothetical protein